jgi:hypothetical protein
MWNRKTTRVVLSSLLFIGLSGVSSCSMSLKEFCDTQAPRFEQEYGRAAGRFGGEIHDLSPPDEFEREEWKKWSEIRLSEVQSVLAMGESWQLPRAQTDLLHTLANELVQFWGFADHGSLPALARSALLLKKRTQDARQSLCLGEPASPEDSIQP